MKTTSLAAGWLCLMAAALAAEENWPQFRGPNMSGVADKAQLPRSWDKVKNVAWVTEIGGHGWSSPIVWGDRVFVTVYRNPQAASPRKGFQLGDVMGRRPAGANEWLVYCLDWNSGQVLWKQLVHKGRPTGPIHNKNTYASETPATDGERIYAYFGNLGLFCYDMSGKKLWEKKLGPYRTRYGWGTGASPIIHKGCVYLINDNEQDSFLLALEGATGKELWKVQRDEKSNWATPFLWENSQRTEIITCGNNKVRSYDLRGQLLWELGGMSSIVIPTPTAKGDLLFIASGYLGDFRQRPIYALKPGAKGDITMTAGRPRDKHIVWHRQFGGPYHPSPLAYGDYLYILNDRGLLSCYEAATGKVMYDNERMPATAFTASPWAADGKIFCLSEDGETFVVQAGPQFRLLERNPLDEMALATPALVRHSVLIRTDTRLYRIDGVKEK